MQKVNTTKKSLWNRVKQHLNPYNVVIGLVLVLYVVLFISLFLYAFFNSLKDSDTFLYDSVGLPKTWLWGNYGIIFKEFHVKKGVANPVYYYLEHMLGISFLYSFGCALAITISTTLMAYVCAMYPSWYTKIIEAIVIFAIIFPIIGSLPSELQMARNLGFYDSFLGNFFLKFSFSNIYFLLIHAAFKGISVDFREAAQIDGASMFRIMVQIMIPLVMNIVGSVFLVQFIGFWNDFSTPLVFLPSYPTLSVGLLGVQYITQGVMAGEPMKLGSYLLASIPIFIVFIIFQRRLMGNLSAGGVKG